ncbi:hypothetical protein SAMN05443144_12236 [Fodinibius roseus]|uniref:Uncharacterized protein n=1 Tax=Fodinibius roseus TaxID=1194090 RepID=A0A1M5I6S7_9BACT|nr:hypothetical protein SAMN05443144_12236 [Fodinibius roseus]
MNWAGTRIYYRMRRECERLDPVTIYNNSNNTHNSGV